MRARNPYLHPAFSTLLMAVDKFIWRWARCVTEVVIYITTTAKSLNGHFWPAVMYSGNGRLGRPLFNIPTDLDPHSTSESVCAQEKVIDRFEPN